MEMVSWGGLDDIHSPASYISSSVDWVYADINSKTGNWTMEENKVFENGLAVYDIDTAERWENIVEMLPGKSLEQVKKHYSYLQQDIISIEAGLIPIPSYTTPYSNRNNIDASPPFTLDWVNSRGVGLGVELGGGTGRFQYHTVKHNHHSSSSSITTTTTTSTATHGAKRHGGRICSDHERKKGVPWTEEEHRWLSTMDCIINNIYLSVCLTDFDSNIADCSCWVWRNTVRETGETSRGITWYQEHRRR